MNNSNLGRSTDGWPERAEALLSVLLLILISLSGCIVPPNLEQSMVLPQDELSVLSLLKQGKDFSASGRNDLAEREFRKALRLRPDNQNIYNDIGYVLQAQSRFEEAEEMYRRGLELDPENVVLQDNLARALYRRGELGGAIKAYHELLDAYLRSDAKKLRSQLGEDFTEAEFVNVYRNLAMAYYSLGVTDEAACYSALAYIIGSNVYEAGRHARLLFSMNKENIALSVLRNTVIARQGNVPAKILLDYGIALFLSGDYTLSQASLSRVLQQTGGTRVDRRTARLLKFSIAQETGGSNKEQESLYEGLLEEDSRFCERTDLDQDNYWPVRLDEIIAGLQSELCDEEKQSFLSN